MKPAELEASVFLDGYSSTLAGNGAELMYLDHVEGKVKKKKVENENEFIFLVLYSIQN